MGTALTGLEIKDTYDGLVKTTDNGPLSGTAKYLSDGLGNDSALALSTASVGIGTASPDQKLNIVGSQTTAYATSSGSEVVPLGGVNMTMQNTGTGGFTSMRFVSLNGSNAIGYLGFANTTSSIGGAFVFGQRSGGGYAEQVRIQEGGGISFNGDTAAANALDDYEEGTFTLTATPSTSGTITLSPNTARYTKIGRQVTIQGFVTISGVSSPVGNAIRLGGLPFTIANAFAAAGAASVIWADASASYVKTALPAFFLANDTQIYAPIDASTVVATDELFINMTYTV
jgi:hypothetical protein